VVWADCSNHCSEIANGSEEFVHDDDIVGRGLEVGGLGLLNLLTLALLSFHGLEIRTYQLYYTKQRFYEA